MKKFIRIIALVLALLTLSGMAVSCANTGDPETTTEAPGAVSTTAPEVEQTEEETLYAPDDLPETMNFGETVTIYMWSNYTMMEFYAEESGDLIDDAIYKRNESVSNRLGIELDFVEEKGASGQMDSWIQKAENDYQSDNTFDIYAGYSRSAPTMALKGMTANLLEYENFSVEKPWWPEALTSECTINDKLLYCTGDISTNLLWMMTATCYNKELYDQYFNGEKTPMDMVQSNEWTMEKLFSMTKDIYTDDSNGKRDELDVYGYVISEINVDAFQTAAGITSIQKNDEGELVVSPDWINQRCADVCSLVGEFLDAEGTFSDNDVEPPRNIFFEERAIFITDRTFIIAGKDTTETGKIEFSYGIVPQPKFDATQETYMTNVGHPFTMYAVNAASKRAEAAVTTLEAMGSANHRSVTPAVFEVAMKVRYQDDPQASEMFDILKNNISFDIGRIYADALGKSTANVFRTTAYSANPSGYITNVTKNKKVIENGLKKIMDFYNG